MIKNFDGNNNSVIEILSSYSALILLNDSGNNNIKVSLPLELWIGYIDKDNIFNRGCLAKYIDNNISYDFTHKKDKNYDFTSDFKMLKEYTLKCDKIRVWSSHIDSGEYCLFLLICYLFPSVQISVIFPDEMNPSGWTLTRYSKDRVKKLVEYEHILTNSEKEDYAKQWIKLINDNKELRYMDNSSVKSCNIDIFDKEIINRLENLGKMNIFSFVADLMLKPIASGADFSDYIYHYLIYRLEGLGKIKYSMKNDKKYIEAVN